MCIEVIVCNTSIVFRHHVHLVVELSGSTIKMLHIMILHFSNIDLLTAVSKFYTKPISSFYREQELIRKQLKTMFRPHHSNHKVRPIGYCYRHVVYGGEAAKFN